MVFEVAPNVTESGACPDVGVAVNAVVGLEGLLGKSGSVGGFGSVPVPLTVIVNEVGVNIGQFVEKLVHSTLTLAVYVPGDVYV
jgi:hypothetical protein